jgi:type II secretory pathway pseudopilin PulG
MRRIAATQAEVVLVMGMLTTLALIVLPGLTETRERARKARCLSNLRTLAAAAQAYASQDSRELLVPIHQSYASTLHAQGWVGPFVAMDGNPYGNAEGAVRLGMPYSFGGRTAVVPFGNTVVMQDSNGFWGARTRPLNSFVNVTRDAAANEDAATFECPADTGYANQPIFREAPRQIADQACFDVLGNSYRSPFTGLFWAGAGNSSTGCFSASALGHSRSSLQQTDRLVLFADGLMNSMNRAIGVDPQSPPTIGWHGHEFADQAAYCDGSARLTNGAQYIGWTTPDLVEMNYTDPNAGYVWFWFLRRNTSWISDDFPTPGARIAMRNPAGSIVTPRIDVSIPLPARTRWPFLNYQNVE